MQSQWAAKRKFFYTTVFIIILAIFVGVPTFFFFYEKPTCFDNKQNQNEKGVDCGGICTRLCASEISNVIILWQRVFQVAPGVYNAVAYVQNPNVQTEVPSITYRFRLYDENNSLIVESRGSTFVPANQTFAIFDSNIRTGSKVASRVVFDFTEQPRWSDRLPTAPVSPLSVQNIILKNEATSPRVEATVLNKTLSTVTKVEAVAIMYDDNDNAIASSRTIIENLNGESSTQIVFTWPAPFSKEVVRKEVVVRVYPAALSF